MDQNPVLIQKLPGRTISQKTRKEPLFLIHDGGGTVFSYFLLGSLGRAVYGISNPYFGTDSGWENGIKSMAECYAKLIKATVPSGKVLLGGWSLGGLIAIQIAHLFANDPDVNVIGIVMIDSSYPVKGRRAKQRSIAFNAEAHTTPEMAEKTRKCMDDARMMTRQWDPPAWRNWAALYTGPDDAQQTDAAPLSPSAALLRATESGSDSSSSQSEAPERAKVQALGFDRYENFDLHSVVDVPGDHFSIFSKENIHELTRRLKESCDTLSKSSARPRY
uniref:HYD n=1 Tax=Phialomyces arenicola TaxID=168477 RepID=A0A6H0XBC6_9EURO|nr:HYD [Phialomyces arenicola]